MCHFRKNVAHAVLSRRAEYIAGRYCAATALRGLLPEFHAPIPIAFDRAPGVFKCLHPIVRRWFDFQDVRIELQPRDGSLRATVLVALNDEVSRGFEIDGCWTVAGELVHTAVLLWPSPLTGGGQAF